MSHFINLINREERKFIFVHNILVLLKVLVVRREAAREAERQLQEAKAQYQRQLEAAAAGRRDQTGQVRADAEGAQELLRVGALPSSILVDCRDA